MPLYRLVFPHNGFPIESRHNLTSPTCLPGRRANPIVRLQTVPRLQITVLDNLAKPELGSAQAEVLTTRRTSAYSPSSERKLYSPTRQRQLWPQR